VRGVGCSLVAGTTLGTLAACERARAPQARALIREQHAPRVHAIVLEMLRRHSRGLEAAAERIAPRFVQAPPDELEPDELETELRQALKLVHSAKRGVPELQISPLSFMAGVARDGHCIARDLEPDPMKGMDLAAQLPTVAVALQGKPGYALGAFTAADGKPSETLVMAAPVRDALAHGRVVGALVLGIPLWRLQQMLTKQLQMELAKQRVVLWVYVYRGDQLHHHGTPPDLDKLVPDAAARAAGLARSPGGFTGEVAQFGYWYGYGVRPLPELGPDAGVVLFRMEPQAQPG